MYTLPYTHTHLASAVKHDKLSSYVYEMLSPTVAKNINNEKGTPSTSGTNIYTFYLFTLAILHTVALFV